MTPSLWTWQIVAYLCCVAIGWLAHDAYNLATKPDRVPEQKKSAVRYWVNTKWKAAGRIHVDGCKWYGIGHGYYTANPPAEAVPCKLCQPQN
ncbi:hypothetical protein [Akkermansia glycaniphila]|uniref:Uncharacterized protein n=1 Tax=Akkermansia glycaniphila TaxID=1679444 RepID=A0A1C7PAE9_9BACT|nr:hypothetical protein [Akkermansia glycaniphila]OCA02304.1 hypothetical protein AC781_10760 [Akkermansia glycaniphila]OCA04210.1 hypothetical protein AC781_00510 [Akkermansia glycaniphila]SEH87433.1 Hypothetical protein PYTT_1370 [Akkermansia glycaniphila]